MSSMKQHSVYSLQHIRDFDILFIYLFWQANAGFMPVISYVYTHELMF